MEKRKYIPVFFNWVEMTRSLSHEEKGRLVDAMVLYARGDDYEAGLEGNERFQFPFFQDMIDRSQALSGKRASAGAAGGAARAAESKRGAVAVASAGEAGDGIVGEVGEEEAVLETDGAGEVNEGRSLTGEGRAKQSQATSTEEEKEEEEEEEEEKEKEEDRESERPRARARARRFTPPTVEEVMDYSDSMGYGGFDAHRFVDYYVANGWQVGRSPMRDWKASVRNWRRRDEEKGVSAHAERREPTDEELFAGLSPEDIALLEQYAADGYHNG